MIFKTLHFLIILRKNKLIIIPSIWQIWKKPQLRTIKTKEVLIKTFGKPKKTSRRIKIEIKLLIKNQSLN